MWAGLKARFRRRDDQEVEERNLQARLERKAKQAAKSISKNASRELIEWEEKHGYRKATSTSSRLLTASSSQTVLDSHASSKHRRSTSTPKTASDTGTWSTPVEQVPAIKQSTTPPPALEVKLDSALGSDLGGLLEHRDRSPTGGETYNLPTPSVGQRPASAMELHTQTVPDEDQDALLKEIAQIRARIQDLRSGIPPNLAVQTSGLPNSAQSWSAKSGSANAGDRRSRTQSSTARHAPWLTPDRSPRPVSLAGGDHDYTSSGYFSQSPIAATGPRYREGRRSVADLFAKDAPGSAYVPHKVGHGSLAAQTPPQIVLESVDGEIGNQGQLLPQLRPRTKSSSSLKLSKSPTTNFVLRDEEAPPLPSHAAEIVRANRASTLIESQQQQQQGVPCHNHRQQNVATRHIVDNPEEARKRLSMALGRSPQPEGRHSVVERSRNRPERRSTFGGEAVGGGLTMAELQERHQAKLRELQGPANAKVAAAHALAEAKAEWSQKLLAEKKEQERKLKERAKAEAAASRASMDASRGNSLMSLRRRTLSHSVLASVPDNGAEPQASATPPAPIRRKSGEGVLRCNTKGSKRLEGAQRAQEWRQSLVAIPSASDSGIGSQEGGDLWQGSQPLRPSDSFTRSRAKSSLGLSNPAAASQAAANHQSHSTASTTRPRSAMVPHDTSLAQFGQSVSNADHVAAGGAAPRHQRQLTSTDLRRLKEGAGRHNATKQHRSSMGISPDRHSYHALAT